MLNISICRDSDIANLKGFIHKNWQEDHILCNSDSLINWQYRNDDGTYNFILAKYQNHIIGVLGFIETKRYDKNLQELNVIWLALWKVKSNNKFPGL